MPRSWLGHQIRGREGAGNGAGAEEEEEIPVVCHSLPQIPDSPRNGLGNAGGPGLCWGSDVAESGEFLEFRPDPPWSGGASICHLFHRCILESGWMLIHAMDFSLSFVSFPIYSSLFPYIEHFMQGSVIPPVVLTQRTLAGAH